MVFSDTESLICALRSEHFTALVLRKVRSPDQSIERLHRYILGIVLRKIHVDREHFATRIKMAVCETGCCY